MSIFAKDTTDIYAIKARLIKPSKTYAESQLARIFRLEVIERSTAGLRGHGGLGRTLHWRRQRRGCGEKMRVWR